MAGKIANLNLCKTYSLFISNIGTTLVNMKGFVTKALLPIEFLNALWRHYYNTAFKKYKPLVKKPLKVCPNFFTRT